MKRFDYFKYEEKENIKHLRKIKPDQALRICFDLINLTIELIKSNLMKKYKHLSKRALNLKVREALGGV